MNAAVAPVAEKPQENLSFFGYARNFTVGLIKDAKFWSRFNAIPNGAIFVAQAVAGTLFLLASAPLIAQVPGIAGCAALAGIGLYGIGYGFPRAWQSMEALCKRTFPTFNPLKKIREPVQALAQNFSRTPLAKKILESRLARLKPGLKTERQQDIFLAGLTMEGASVAAVACGIAIAPVVMALPAITIAGGLAMAGAGWMITTCVFDVYCSAKTLFQAYRSRKREKQVKPSALKLAKPVPAQLVWKPKVFPAPVTPGFNQNADRGEVPSAKPPLSSFPANKPNHRPGPAP